MNALDNFIDSYRKKITTNPSDILSMSIFSSLTSLQKLVNSPSEFNSELEKLELSENIKSLLRIKHTENNNNLLYEKDVNGILISIQYIESMKKFISDNKLTINSSWDELLNQVTNFYFSLRDYALLLLNEGFSIENKSPEHIKEKYGNKGILDYFVSAYNNITNVSAKSDKSYFKRAEQSICLITDDPFREIFLGKFNKEFGSYGAAVKPKSQFYKPYLNITKFPGHLIDVQEKFEEYICSFSQINSSQDIVMDQSSEAIIEDISDSSALDNSITNTPKIVNLDELVNSIKDLQAIIVENLNLNNGNQVDYKGFSASFLSDLSTLINNSQNNSVSTLKIAFENILEKYKSLNKDITLDNIEQLLIEQLRNPHNSSTTNSLDNTTTALTEFLKNIDDKFNSSSNTVNHNLTSISSEIKEYIENKLNGFSDKKVADHIAENLKVSQSDFIANAGDFLHELKSETIAQLENYSQEIDRKLGSKLTDTHASIAKLNVELESTNSLLSTGGQFGWIKSIIVGAISGLVFFAAAFGIQQYFNSNSAKVAQYKLDSAELNRIYSTVQNLPDDNNKNAIIKILNLNLNKN